MWVSSIQRDRCAGQNVSVWLVSPASVPKVHSSYAFSFADYWLLGYLATPFHFYKLKCRLRWEYDCGWDAAERKLCSIFKYFFSGGTAKTRENNASQYPVALPPAYNCRALRCVTKQGDYLPLLLKDHVSITSRTCTYISKRGYQKSVITVGKARWKFNGK